MLILMWLSTPSNVIKSTLSSVAANFDRTAVLIELLADIQYHLISRELVSHVEQNCACATPALSDAM